MLVFSQSKRSGARGVRAGPIDKKRLPRYRLLDPPEVATVHGRQNKWLRLDQTRVYHNTNNSDADFTQMLARIARVRTQTVVDCATSAYIRRLVNIASTKTVRTYTWLLSRAPLH